MRDQRATALLRAPSLWIRPFRTQTAKLFGGGAREERLHGNSVRAGEPADAGTS